MDIAQELKEQTWKLKRRLGNKTAHGCRGVHEEATTLLYAQGTRGVRLLKIREAI